MSRGTIRQIASTLHIVRAAGATLPKDVTIYPAMIEKIHATSRRFIEFNLISCRRRGG